MADEEKGAKWWLRNIAVPLIVAGIGATAVVVSKKDQQKQTDAVQKQTQTQQPLNPNDPNTNPKSNLNPNSSPNANPTPPQPKHRSTSPVSALHSKESASSDPSTSSIPQPALPDEVATKSVELFTGHSIQDKLRLCEEPAPNPNLIGDCGVLIWNGTQYNGVWSAVTLLSQRDLPEQPGALKGLGSVTIQRSGNGLVLRRADASGITCLYRGAISGVNVATGTHVCKLQGETIVSGTWKVIPKP
jgi:hypothetical protein